MKLGVAGVFLMCVSCTLPNLGAIQEIKPGECVDACRGPLDTCFDNVTKRVDFCQSIEDGDNTTADRNDCTYATGPYKGSTSVFNMTKACLDADQTCISACIKKTEDQLKEIK